MQATQQSHPALAHDSIKAPGLPERGCQRAEASPGVSAEIDSQYPPAAPDQSLEITEALSSYEIAEGVLGFWNGYVIGWLVHQLDKDACHPYVLSWHSEYLR